MSIRERLAEWISGKTVTATSAAGWCPITSGTWQSGSAIWQRDSEALGKYYGKNGLIHACIREKATSLADADLQVGYEVDGVFEPLPDHEVLNLFYENPDYSYCQIIELISARLDLYGAAYALLAPFENRFGVGEFTPIPSHLVGKKTRGATVIGYEIKTERDPIPVDVLEMCAIELLDPSSFHRVMSPTQTILRDAGIDAERQQITMEILKNKALPGLFLRPESNLPEATRKQLKDSLDLAAGGEGRARGAVTVLPSKISIEKGADVTDIDFDVLNGLTESRICMAYQVPPILIAAKVGLDKSTYSNYASARESFYKETVKPLWAFIADALTRQILTRDPATADLIFRFDMSKIPDLQEDMNTASTRASLLFEKKVATRDEARGMVGLPPVGGELGGFASDPVPVSPFGAMTAETPVEGNAKIDRHNAEIDGKAAAIGTFPEAVALEEALKREFRKQRDEAVKSLQETGLIQMITIGKGMADAIEATLIAIAQQQAMTTIRQVESMAKSSRTGLEGKVSVVGAFDVVNPLLERRIKDQAIFLAESTLATTQKSIDDTLGALREELVRVGVRGTNTVKALTEGVLRVFENAELHRARTIAITESARAVNDARIMSASATGVVQGFEPLVSPDACELCQVYEGGKATGQPLFPFTDLRGAGAQVGQYEARSLPPYHPNCLVGETPCFAISPEVAFVSTYCGAVFNIRLTDGRMITATSNHMFLTNNGFAKAQFIRKGDYVVDASGFNGVIFGSPDNNGNPSSIQKIVETLAEAPGMTTARVPVSTEYLHGDGKFSQGEIHIVAANGFLKGDGKTLGYEHIGEDFLQSGNANTVGLSGLRDLASMLIAMRDATDSGMGGIRERKALLLAKSRHAEIICSGTASDRYSVFLEDPADYISADSKAIAQVQARFSSKVRFAKVASVKMRDFCGHVYDLHTKSSLYIANGIVSSNCRCTTQPVLITEPTPQHPSGEPLPQGGEKAAAPRLPRPGGNPEPTLPLREFLNLVVEGVAT